MLNSLLASQPGDARPEHIYFVHGARDANDHPFSEQLMAVAAAHPHVSVHLRDSRPNEVTREDGVRSVGRVDIEFLKRVLPFGDYDFYLCGPGAFMQDLYSGLRALNIADDRIRFEAFGPASVKRTQSAAVVPVAEAAATALAAGQRASAPDPAKVSKVVFTRTGRDAMWSKEAGTLLDFAEANDVPAQSNCRSGVCGTCSTRVLSGEVSYPTPIEGDVAPGHALICSAIPARTGTGEESTVVLDL
jgi:ferredoxin-NADP reductase